VSFFSRFLPHRAHHDWSYQGQSLKIQRKKPQKLDRETATQVGRDIEANNPELVVVDVRLVWRDGRSVWTIDVVNRTNGRITSLDDHDDWTRRLQEILPDRTTADARVVGRQVAHV
jgi:hypothetical protein